MDGHPLVRGVLVAEGALEGMDQESIAVWLACFAEKVPLRQDVRVPEIPCPHLRRLLQRTGETAELLGEDSEQFAWSSAALVRTWMKTRDVREIAAFVDVAQLGSFVRLVLRVAAFFEELRMAALGMEMFELYNRLEGAAECLYSGVVTNQSLYVTAQKSLPPRSSS
jgi:superfamily II RNA helicase